MKIKIESDMKIKTTESKNEKSKNNQHASDKREKFNKSDKDKERNQV